MDEFLARFANPVRRPADQDAEPEQLEAENTGISFFSRNKPVQPSSPSRKKAFAVHVGFEDDDASSSSSSSSSSESSSSSSDSQPETRSKSRRRGLIVDKTKVEHIDIHEFIAAIQRKTDIQIGKPDTSSFATCPPVQSLFKQQTQQTQQTSSIETFPIRKLGFMVELKMSESDIEP